MATGDTEGDTNNDGTIKSYGRTTCSTRRFKGYTEGTLRVLLQVKLQAPLTATLTVTLKASLKATLKVTLKDILGSTKGCS